MPVHGHLGGFSLGGNGIDRDAADALIEKQLVGGVEDTLARWQTGDSLRTHGQAPG
ncbi:hypothetical protein D3C80_1932140 [compost metagenome]